MTRIILQRSFLLLAFTGILLSRAQESTLSVLPDTDPKSSGSPSSSAPESSSIEIVSPLGDTPEGGWSANPPQPTSVSGKSSLDGDEASRSGEKLDSNDKTPTEEVGHSDGLFRDEPLRDSEPEIASQTSSTSRGGTFTENDPPVTTNHVTDVRKGTVPLESSKSPEVTVTSGKDAQYAVDKSTPYSSSDDPAPSTVPSMDSRSSNLVRRDQTTQVSTVQIGVHDGPTTRTRSLNATVGDAVGDASRLTTSPLIGTEDESADNLENGTDAMVSPPEVPTSYPDEDKSSRVVSEEMVAEVTRDMDSAASSPDVAAIHSERVEHMILDATRTSPISLAALSSFSEDSIHSRGSTKTAQILDASTAPPSLGESSRMTLPKSSELEQEFSDFVHHSDSTESLLVTFDPDGMTHNSSQDPDAITFTPVTFHVDGMSTEGRRTTGGSGRPSVPPSSVKFTDETTRSFELLEGNVNEEDREREPLSPANNGQSPHDEPDREELSSKNTLSSTRRPFPPPVPSATMGLVPPANDESEEMMNDSPQFGPIQSKPTTTLDKELEENVSNDISLPTGASSHHTKATPHELDFSTDHQSEQSEFRPVTASSPPESPTSPLRDSPSVEPQAPSSSDVARPDQTESVSSTSPNIVSNPAPSVANQSAEAVTAVLQQTDGVTEGGNATTSNIAGVAVKTSVSVSLPLSNTPSSGGSNSSVDVVADDAILPNISGILPFPIHLDTKESGVQTAAPLTDAPSTTSGGLRIRKPKIKIGGSTEGPADSTPRTRKPFLAPPQRSSTTAGPPVSIFKKSRTRGASITSSTTARPFPQFSTVRVHYASRMPGVVPGGELVFSVEPITTTVPTTTETEEPYSEENFTDTTQGPVVPPNDDDITLIKVAGCLTVDKGLRWHEQLNNRHSPLYREKANYVQIQLERLFRTSPIASQVWKIQIDGFSGRRQSRSVVIDFFLYLIKSRNAVSTTDLTLVFHDKLINNTFSRFTVDPSKTTFEFLNEEPMRPPTEAPESSEPDPVLPQWAIAVIVVGAASLIFIVLFAVVAILGRHHMRRRYSSKLNDEDSDRPGDWETKMAAAYENLAADTIYDAEDLHSDTYKKKDNATYHGRPSKPQRADSWSSSDWSPPPRRPRPQVHRIVY